MLEEDCLGLGFRILQFGCCALEGYGVWDSWVQGYMAQSLRAPLMRKPMATRPLYGGRGSLCDKMFLVVKQHSGFRCGNFG